MHILFGTDIDSTRVTVRSRPNIGAPFEWVERHFSDAIETTFDQVFETISIRLPNPIWNALYKATGKCYSFSEKERVNDENCIIVRETMRQYIRKRVSGEAKSDLLNDSDVLSLMLKNSDVFNEEDIIDELLDFLVAGTMTTQMSM